MPKRTNEFQRLIHLIQTALSHEATVTESAELLDTLSSKKREVDVVVRSKEGSHPIVVSIECTARGRPASSTWVDEMWGKHSHLPTDKLILVSKAGFTRPAKDLAEKHHIRALTLEDAEACDWSSAVRELGPIPFVSFVRPRAITAKVLFAPESGLPDLDKADIATSPLYSADGQKSTTPDELVKHWLRDPALVQRIQNGASDEGRTIIVLKAPLKDGVYHVDKDGTRRIVREILIKAECWKRVGTLQLDQGTFGDAAVAHGVVDAFGSPVEVAVVQEEGGDLKVTMRVPKKLQPRVPRTPPV